MSKPVTLHVVNRKALIASGATYIKCLLPYHFKVEAKSHGIDCQSTVGIDDDEIWGYYMSAIRQHFGEALREVTIADDRHQKFSVFL